MKVGIVGSGLVGATAAYALLMRGVGRSIVLVDKNRARAEAEADDLLHAVPFAHPLNVAAGDYADLAGSRVVIIAAGANQKPGETRLQLLGRNAAIFREVVGSILQHAPEVVLVVATNPVDVMTHLTAHYAVQHGAPASRVIGSGTTLDTARFRALLGRHLGVDPQHVHAYVIGEHGDSQVPLWSLANIAGVRLDEYAVLNGKPLDGSHRQTIAENTRRAAYEIIKRKAATYYAIAAGLVRIIETIVRDEKSVLTVSGVVDGTRGWADAAISLPRVIDRHGIAGTLALPLSGEEEAALNRSAQVIREAVLSLALDEQISLGKIPSLRLVLEQNEPA
jgi:L-lactate dehydrogenase